MVYSQNILYYTILYYTTLYYTILYYTILYYTILYYTILYYIYYTIQYYTILYYTIRSPLLGVCILRTTTYWGCESTVCVDQLNPSGFNVSNLPDNENPRFFPARETGNPNINMAGENLWPKTFTSSSASGSDYDISLKIPLKMKTKTYTLKLPVIIIIRPRKQCKA